MSRTHVLLYRIWVYHIDNPKKVFVMYDWLERTPKSKGDLVLSLEEHLLERCITGYKVVKVQRVIDKDRSSSGTAPKQLVPA